MPAARPLAAFFAPAAATDYRAGHCAFRAQVLPCHPSAASPARESKQYRGQGHQVSGDIMAKRWWLFLLLGYLLYGEARAELRVAFATARPPYSYTNEHGKNVGLEIDLLRTLLGRMGQQMRVVLYPNTRLVLSALQHEVDVAATVQGMDGRGLYFSHDYVWFNNVAISLAIRGIRLDSVDDLDYHTFVIWQDGWRHLGPSFEAKYRPDSHGKFPANYNEAPDQAMQSKMFWAGRTELIVVDRAIFAYYRKALPASYHTGQAITVHDIFKTRTAFAVAFKQQALRDRFNAELKKLQDSGEYAAIQEKYLGMDSVP